MPYFIEGAKPTEINSLDRTAKLHTHVIELRLENFSWVKLLDQINDILFGLIVLATHSMSLKVP